MGMDPWSGAVVDDDLRALARCAIAHGAVDNAIAAVISMLASLLAAPRGDVRASHGAMIRPQVRSALAAGGAARAGADDDFNLLARIAVAGGAGASDEVLKRIVAALGCLPDAARDGIRARNLDAARTAAERALAAR